MLHHRIPESILLGLLGIPPPPVLADAPAFSLLTGPSSGNATQLILAESTSKPSSAHTSVTRAISLACGRRKMERVVAARKHNSSYQPTL